MDTCVFYDAAFMRWLASYNGNKQIPPVVYMERCRQILEKNGTVEELDRYLNNLNINVLRFERNDARRAAELMAGRTTICEKCKKIDWADTIVASYINAGNFIISNDRDDFPTSVEFEDRVLTTIEIMNLIDR
jgi:predicted nucleic acid-binding protein